MLTLGIRFETIWAVRLDTQPHIKAFNVVQMITTWKLLKLLLRLEITETDAASRETQIFMQRFESDYLDFCEFLRCQSSLYEIYTVLVQCLYRFITSLYLLLNISLSVFIEVVV